MGYFGKLLETLRIKKLNKIPGKKMTTLDVKKLTSCGSDWETNQYTILNKVKFWLSNLHRNKLFPALEESIELNLSLEEILKENLECKLWFDNEIRARRINERFTVYEKAHQIGFQLDKLFEFIEWALKLNKPVIEEGMILKSFVEENIIVRKISSSVKNFLGKGYFTLPDNKKGLLNIYFYKMDWDWTLEYSKNIIKTKLIRSIPNQLVKNPVDELMKEFLNHSQVLYEPAVYVMETELDFPYKETMFPIAEEKLISVINS